MSVLETLAALPSVRSLRIARDIIDELKARGMTIVQSDGAAPRDHPLVEALRPADDYDPGRPECSFDP